MPAAAAEGFGGRSCFALLWRIPRGISAFRRPSEIHQANCGAPSGVLRDIRRRSGRCSGHADTLRDQQEPHMTLLSNTFAVAVATFVVAWTGIAFTGEASAEQPKTFKAEIRYDASQPAAAIYDRINDQ